jgi:hypothetical protein
VLSVASWIANFDGKRGRKRGKQAFEADVDRRCSLHPRCPPEGTLYSDY